MADWIDILVQDLFGAEIRHDEPLEITGRRLRVALSEALGPGLLEIIAERRAHLEREGYGDHHDDQHRAGELVRAAAAYALAATEGSGPLRGLKLSGAEGGGGRLLGWILQLWPWSLEWWKPKNVRRDLVRSASLIVAELDREDRV